MPDYLSDVEQQLVVLTEQGRHRPRRPGAEALVLMVALAVVAAVVVAVAGVGRGAHHAAVPGHRGSPHRHAQVLPAAPLTGPRTVTLPSAGRTSLVPPAGGPVPPGFGPESFTAIGEYTWWLLGPAPCSSPPCTSIVRTLDGGRSFVGIPAPRTSQVSQLRFEDDLNGFAYDPQLWSTHDGGAHWRRVPLPGTATELAASDGWVYAIVWSGGQARLWHSPAGADRWSVLPAAGHALSGLWVQGPDVLLQSGDGASNQLFVSGDRGAAFVAYPVPPSVACQFESPALPVVWGHCSTGMLSSTWRSRDGGRTFAPAAGGAAGPVLPNSAAFAAASADTAVAGYQKLYRTTDGGASWRPVPGLGAISHWQYLGFTDPTHGVAIGYAGTETARHERLYYTTDGGASYHLVAIR
jgi:photosystem II stability/assembly factor-like uncharacterized protein